MTTLLVIGGTGFFGKSILDAFQRGQLQEWGVERVIAMSRKADTLRVEAPELVDHRVELLNADIGNTVWLPTADYVIHAAASTDARNYLARPEEERQNIQAGVYNYCRLSPIYHARSKIIYVSSGAVYGTQPPDLEYISESYEIQNSEDIPEGKRDYAVAKRDAEIAFKALAAKGFDVSIARCFAFVGRWLPRDQHFAIGNFIEDGLQGRQIKVKATFPVYRSYMYADDLIHWLMTIVANADSDCVAYNVGSDESLSIEEVAMIVANVFKVGIDIQPINSIKCDRYVPSVLKAKCRFSLGLTKKIEQAIRSTVLGINLGKSTYD